ncbi:hypothetical protein R3P38DRAFT_2588040, partial [Favolaschia claudopus]
MSASAPQLSSHSQPPVLQGLPQVPTPAAIASSSSAPAILAPTTSTFPISAAAHTLITSSTASLALRRPNRSSSNVPIPVPNLIKKSRGRRVPVVAAFANGTAIVTPNGAANGAANGGKRMHICQVQGCGKCFHRGEHLKRHIRSIHTYEKPYPCTFPSCQKFFNRHDNLLQHIKVHR